MAAQGIQTDSAAAFFTDNSELRPAPGERNLLCPVITVFPGSVINRSHTFLSPGISQQIVIAIQNQDAILL